MNGKSKELCALTVGQARWWPVGRAGTYSHHTREDKGLGAEKGRRLRSLERATWPGVLCCGAELLGVLVLFGLGFWGATFSSAQGTI